MPSTDHADLVCLQCKRRKRKCDKLLPSCSLCKRLGRTCHYEPLEKISASSTQPALASSGLLPDPTRSITFQDVFEIIRAQFITVIGTDVKALHEASIYFNSVHLWFPILDPDLYYKQMSSSWNLQRPEFLLLSLSMFLVNARPDGIELSSQVLALYTSIKGFIGLFDSIGPTSLELIQVRLLITIFESGHGKPQSAYMTMGSTLRAAVALGLNNDSPKPSQTSLEQQRKAEEEKRVWWGVMIMDRYAALDICKRGSEFRVMASPHIETSSDKEGLTAMSCPFSMLLHASRILEQVQAHMHDPTPQDEFNTTEAMQIVSTLRSFKALLEEMGPSEAEIYNPSVALCESASLILWCHLEVRDKERCAKSSKSTFRAAVGDILARSHSLDQNPSIVDLERVPIFALSSIYIAASALTSEPKALHNVDAVDATATLKNILTHFSRRWLAGRRYLERLSEDLGPCLI
ncbi:fungal-specific transcription factor domain-containing protein [Aspergillus insuetus]